MKWKKGYTLLQGQTQIALREIRDPEACWIEFFNMGGNMNTLLPHA